MISLMKSYLINQFYRLLTSLSATLLSGLLDRSATLASSAATSTSLDGSSSSKQHIAESATQLGAVDARDGDQH
jgi:hypothetical protein